MKIILLSISVLLLCWVPVRKSPQSRIHLFNKKDLTNWDIFLRGKGLNHDESNVFSVENGLLHISGELYGGLISKEKFKNFRLVAEYKWGDQTWANRDGHARDAGILIHSTGLEGAYDHAWMYSIECQIIEGGTGDFIVIGDGSDSFSITCPVAGQKQDGCYVFRPEGLPATISGSGRINWLYRDSSWQDVKGFRGKKDLEKPPGQWNRFECISHEGEVWLYLNGKVVNHAIKVRPSIGKIQLQSEGAEIYFRQIDMFPEPDNN